MRLTKVLSRSPQSSALMCWRTLCFFAPGFFSYLSARRIAFLYLLAQDLRVDAFVLLYCSYLSLCNNPLCDIDLPVSFVNHAATCLDVCFFKCFLAFSSAANSSGIGSYTSGLSSHSRYPNGALRDLLLLRFGI